MVVQGGVHPLSSTHWGIDIAPRDNTVCPSCTGGCKVWMQAVERWSMLILVILSVSHPCDGRIVVLHDRQICRQTAKWPQPVVIEQQPGGPAWCPEHLCATVDCRAIWDALEDVPRDFEDGLADVTSWSSYRPLQSHTSYDQRQRQACRLDETTVVQLRRINGAGICSGTPYPVCTSMRQLPILP